MRVTICCQPLALTHPHHRHALLAHTPPHPAHAHTLTQQEDYASRQPYADWLERNMLNLKDWASSTVTKYKVPNFHFADSTRRFNMFGYTAETMDVLLLPMAIGGREALGSMGNDAPLAVLSEKPRLIFDYFKQLFAQVSATLEVTV
jgi:Glutamate synthase central domain